MTQELLTKVDAFILRTVEMERDITREEIARRIKSRYGVDIDVSSRLKDYTPPDEPQQIFWS